VILLETITHDEVEQIHEATLAVLNEVGVLMTHTGARDMLSQAEAERLLEHHEVAPLAEEQSRELASIMQVAKKELVGQ
jgi:trimethylamine:corrinoid methyltransferase-like protein